eukprot:1342359-Pleurochrysis_carterae.AAC.2
MPICAPHAQVPARRIGRTRCFYHSPQHKGVYVLRIRKTLCCVAVGVGVGSDTWTRDSPRLLHSCRGLGDALRKLHRSLPGGADGEQTR